MTNAQYAEWFRHHLNCFPAVSEWIGKAGEGTAAAWRRCLADVSLHHAKQSTDAMHRGELGTDLFFDKHPTLIRMHSLVLRKNEHNAKPAPPTAHEPYYTCKHCLDSGWLSIYTIKTMRWVMDNISNRELITEDGHLTGKHLMKFIGDYVCACGCLTGDTRHKPPAVGGHQPRGVVRYHDDRMVLVGTDRNTLDISRLVAHIQKVIDSKREQAFMDFNER